MADQQQNLNNLSAQAMAENSKKSNGSKSNPFGVITPWIMPLASLGALVVLGLFVVKPWYEDIVDKQNTLSAARTEVSQLMSKLEVLNAQDPEGLKAYLVRLNFAVPSQSSPPLILASVEQALNSAGMAIENVQYGGIRQKEQIQQGDVLVSKSDDLEQAAAPTTNDPIKELEGGYVDVSLAAQGDYGQVVDFLKTIHKINPLILGINFNLTLNQAAGGGQDTADKSFTFEGSGPFQDIPSDLGAVNTEIQGLSREELRLIEGLEGLTTFFDPEKATETNQYPTGKTNPF